MDSPFQNVTKWTLWDGHFTQLLHLQEDDGFNKFHHVIEGTQWDYVIF
jgi:hypothetical protein